MDINTKIKPQSRNFVDYNKRLDKVLPTSRMHEKI